MQSTLGSKQAKPLLWKQKARMDTIDKSQVMERKTEMHISDRPHNTNAIVRRRVSPTTIIDVKSLSREEKVFSSWPSPAKEIATTLDSSVGDMVRDYPLPSKTLIGIVAALLVTVTVLGLGISSDVADAEEEGQDAPLLEMYFETTEGI